MRCDKGSPCSTCVKYANPVCEYSKDLLPYSRTSVSDGSAGNSTLNAASRSVLDPVMAVSSANGQFSPGSYAVRDPYSSSSSAHSGLLALENGLTLAIPAVHSELELLKQKILLLEKSVVLPPTDPIVDAALWRGSGDASGDDLHFLRGRNPFIPRKEIFSFHGPGAPFLNIKGKASRFYAPLTWISLVSTDSLLRHVFTYHLKHFHRYHTFTFDHNSSSKPSEVLFVNKFAHESSIAHDMGYRPKQEDQPKYIQKYHEKAKLVGLTVYDGDIPNDMDMVEKLLLFIPSRKVLWMLIDRFFARVYVYFPFLDQTDFELQIARLLGSDSREHEKITKIYTTQKMDTIYMGLLIIVLRFGYLSLFKNSEALNEARLYPQESTKEAEEVLFLMSNPIPMDSVDLAQMSLHQFGFLRYSNLRILQLCLYLKLYYIYAPENCDSADDTNAKANTAMLVNTALSLGLHREPDRYGQRARDEKTDHLCRKIWYFLLNLDITESISTGLAPCTNRDYFDTSPPYYEPGNENVRDTEVESNAVKILRRFDKFYDPLHQVVSKVAKVGNQMNVACFCKLLDKLEAEYLNDLKPEIFEQTELTPVDAAAAIESKTYMQMNFFILCVSFHFFNFYERLGDLNLAYFYLKKVLNVALNIVLPFYDGYAEKSSVWFRDSTDIAFAPTLQTLTHKCLIVLLAVSMRCRFSMLECETLHNHERSLLCDSGYKRRYDLLNEVHDLSCACLNYFLDICSTLSNRYYYSWRCLKAQRKMKKIRENPEFYLSWCKGKETRMAFNNDILEDMVALMKHSLDKVQSKDSLKFRVDTPSSDIRDIFSNGGGTPSGSIPLVTDPEVDDWWMQMLSVKPFLGKPVLYNSQPPPQHIALGNVDYNLNLDDFNIIFDSYQGEYKPT